MTDLDSRISKRSLALTLIGLSFVFQGIRASGVELTDPEWGLLHEMIPRPVRTAAWIATGAVTIACSWTRKWQWAAAASAVIMPIERVISYLWSTGHWFFPGPPRGSLWSLVDAGAWAAMFALIVVIGGWIEWDRAGDANGA